MFGVFGLIAGLVIGFVLSNSVNRSAGETVAAPAAASNTSGSQGSLPPDHPPLGTSAAAGESRGTAMPQIAEAIDKARLEPNNYEAQMTAADLYYQIQRFAEAARIYETAAKLRPGAAEPLIKAGNAHFDTKQYEQAEKWYLLALQKEPKNLSVRTDLGLTFFLREPPDLDRAIKEYKASLAIDPDHELTLQNLAAAYREAGDDDNTWATLERLRRVNPNNPALASRQGS
jgi:tetratricopeptide (TPR) repeat protein